MNSSSSTRRAKPKENCNMPASSASERTRLAMSMAETMRQANNAVAVNTMIFVCERRAFPVLCAPKAARAIVSPITNPTTPRA
ncbi:hypothetical protein HBI38_104150 [Parastagonospora nodorum]|nr:hypothetical protein HBI38_104150 [Parastagonospora nodorum]